MELQVLLRVVVLEDHDERGDSVLDGVDEVGILVHHAKELDDERYSEDQVFFGDASVDVGLDVDGQLALQVQLNETGMS